ncbi:MAG: penicillin-binding protein 1A [Alphaproteobacteria bacterium]|jgi:penicillin-binding protein 1A
MSSPELRAESPLDPERAASGAEAPRAEPPPKKKREKRPKHRRRFGLFRWLFSLAAAVLLAGGIAAYGAYHHFAQDLPDYGWLAEYEPPQMSRVYAADSRLMAELAQERRIFVPIEAIPQRVQQAFISAEDQRFREHTGIDPLGILRAVIQAAEQYGSGRRMSGASTITQQVAKNMLVGADRSFTRKAREAILAMRIEKALSKDRILELYLNEIFLGQQAYGVAAAAQVYFNKSLDELNVADVAYLAALPKAPNNYHPIRRADAAKARRDWVIERMLEDRAITAEEARAARAEPLLARPMRRQDQLQVGQHFTEEVRREMIQRFGVEQTTMGGLVARTSLDPTIQAAAERSLREGLMSYDRRRGGWRGPVARISASTTEWMPALADTPRPAGALPEWRLAVVLEVRPQEARLGWLERRDPRRPAEPQQGTLYLEELRPWARPVLPDGRLGAEPRRVQDVVNIGDVVMVETLPAEAAQRNRPARPERLTLKQIPLAEGAVVALDPQTGRVMAMVGGWALEKSWFNRATQAQRQPGSSFKPFVYIAALEKGIPPNQEIPDEPVEIMTPQGLWKPQNYNANTYNGWVTMRSAMERSLNLVTVRLADHVGMASVSDAARRFGVIDNMPRYLAMSLGAGETTVLRMATAYGAFANGGFRVTPTLIDSVQDRRGRVIWRADQRACAACASGPEAGPPRLEAGERQRATDPISAYQMVSILEGVVQRGTAAGTIGSRLGRPVAGKTGTTDDFKDNWFVGFTPDIVVAVWIGFDDPRSLGNNETGGSNAAPIFREVVGAALTGSPPVPFRRPPGITLMRVATGTGSIMEPFRPGTENSAQRWRDEFITERADGSATPGSPGANRLDRDLGGLY